jgi:hypothetical protein
VVENTKQFLRSSVTSLAVKVELQRTPQPKRDHCVSFIELLPKLQIDDEVHLANANKFGHIHRINTALGLHTPTLITPLELLGESL